MKGLSTNKTSSDLALGRRPELKSEEVLFVDNPLHEISRCEHFFTAEKVLHLFGALPLGGGGAVGAVQPAQRSLRRVNV